MKLNLLLAVVASTLFIGMSPPSFASSVRLQWEPNTESDLAGYKIYYKQGSSAEPFNGIGAWEGNSPIQLQNQTTAILSGLDPGETYYFAVTAYNADGLESPYSNVVSDTIPEADTSAPVVSTFTIPSTTSLLTVPITAIIASDNVGVTGYLLTQSTSTIPAVGDAGWTPAPATSFSFSSAGSKTLCAWAQDAAGNISNGICKSVTITLPDTIPPTISFNTPTGGTIIQGTSTVNVTANDNVGVTKVEFYVNGMIHSTDTAAPYAFAWNTATLANGSYTLSAKAYDAAGNVGQSTPVTVTVAKDTIAPVVSAFSSVNVRFSPSVVLTATATDNVAVVKMTVSANGRQIASANAAKISWTFKDLSTGRYTVVIRAYDAAGNVGSKTATVYR